MATSLVSLISQCYVLRGGPALLVGLVRQRFLMHGRSTLLVGLVGQRFLPRGHLVAMAPVEIGGIKLGYLCGSERRGKNESAVVHRTSLWGRP
jgi:hypothetical protein